MKTFLVYHDNYGDPVKVHACDPEHAAETFAEEYDSDNDYTFSDGDEVIVEDGNGIQTNFYIYGEQTIVYHAREICTE